MSVTNRNNHPAYFEPVLYGSAAHPWEANVSQLRKSHLTRRSVLGSAFVLTAALCMRCPCHAGEVRRYCLVRGAGSDEGQVVAASSYSSPEFIRLANLEHRLHSKFFKTRYELGVDLNGTGAYYDVDTQKVVISDLLIRAIGNNDYGVIRLAAVLAHEVSHSFQVQHKIDNLLTEQSKSVKYLELHADYMAGYYIAWRGLISQIDPVHIAATFYQLGDIRLGDEDHHGTQTQRYLAFRQGYLDFGKYGGDGAKAGAGGLLFVRQLYQ